MKILVGKNKRKFFLSKLAANYFIEKATYFKNDHQMSFFTWKNKSYKDMQHCDFVSAN